jgi:hypothetical protein
MSSTVGLPAYGVLWTDFDRGLRLTRITCRAKESDQGKYYDSQWVKSSFKADLKASYMDRNEKSGILCGALGE